MSGQRDLRFGALEIEISPPKSIKFASEATLVSAGMLKLNDKEKVRLAKGKIVLTYTQQFRKHCAKHVNEKKSEKYKSHSHLQASDLPSLGVQKAAERVECRGITDGNETTNLGKIQKSLQREKVGVPHNRHIASFADFQNTDGLNLVKALRR
jgi:hypothetical protein